MAGIDTHRSRLEELSALQKERPLFRDELEEVADLFAQEGNSGKARQARAAAGRAPERDDVPFSLAMPSPPPGAATDDLDRPAGYEPRAPQAMPTVSSLVAHPPSAEPFTRPRSSGGQGWRTLIQLLGAVVFFVGLFLWCGNVFGFFPTVPLAGYLTMGLGAGIAKAGSR